MITRRSTRIAALVVAGVASSFAMAPTLAGAQDDTDKVTVCHATSNDKKPYHLVVVDVSAADFDLNGHDSHTGPLWNASLKDQGISWGDIIPPYNSGDVNYPGLNWTGGAAWVANDCNEPPPPEPTTTAAAPLVTTTTAKAASAAAAQATPALPIAAAPRVTG